MRVGDFMVSGQLRQLDENDVQPNEYFLDGNVNVVFGGMGFGGSSLYFVGRDGNRFEALPESMIISENSALLMFYGGTELIFASHQVRGLPEIRIAAVFAEDIAGIELPFAPQRRTRFMDLGNGQFIAVAGGVNHSFGSSPMDLERRVLFVNAGGRPVSYRAIPDRRVFSPYDFILTQAETAGVYDEFLVRWRDRNFALWSRAVSTANNEDIVIANVSEAFVRGGYEAAVTAVPASFLGGNARTYRSSAYLGGLDQAHLSLAAAERETLRVLSQQIDERSLQFLTWPRVFEHLAVRGLNNLIDAASNIVRDIDPDTLYLGIVPGIFEGFADWRRMRPGANNPFEPLMEQVYSLVSDSLTRTANASGDLVLVIYDGNGEAEFNLRLGAAIMAHAENERNETWAGIGRSIVLSALSLAESTGPELSARLYNNLGITDVRPRAAAIASPGIWAWTASAEVSAVQQSDVLNISARFPVGESHYMIIRGLRPFVRLQLYNMDWRSDPQFERFDVSGWRYIPQEQTLLVKMRHRTNIENIRIIFREVPPPVVAPPIDNDNGNANTEG